MNPELERAKRENAKNLDLKSTTIRAARVAHRLGTIWLLSSLIIVGLAGWATVVSLWRNYPAPFGWFGLFAGLISTAFATREILKRRPHLASLNYEYVLLQNEQVSLAATSATDPVTALRIYRVAAQDDVESYRRAASRNRHIHNAFQGIVIVGSIIVTSFTSAGLGTPWLHWSAAAIAALVSVAAGFTGYFKYRERSFNQQQTADAIEKESKAMELRIEAYDGIAEEEALKRFAKKVEELKEEQRKRELQLEQTSHPEERNIG